MGKAPPVQQMAPVPPPPPQTPVRSSGDAVGSEEAKTPTEELARREQEKQAVVTSPDTEPTPQIPAEPIYPASVLDTETPGRKEERRLAGRKGRRATRATGPKGLLTPAPVKKRGLLGY